MDRARRALIVDDDKAIADILALYLRDEGFVVTTKHDGLEALEAAKAEPFDVILLDLNLPTLSGVEIFKTVRRISDVPILIVTARDDTIDRIVALELGADDYIAKPFTPREVVARVRNVVNRADRSERQPPAGSPVPQEVQRIGDLELNRSGHEVRLNGEQIRLTPTEFRILDVLLRNAGVALTRAQLLESAISDSADIFDRTLDKHIGNLRQKIGDDPNKPQYIITVHGVGYKLAVAARNRND